MADTIITHSNAILDTGGSNQLTLYSLSVEEIWNKTLNVIKRPQTKSGAASGPKATKILDLLKVELRFELRGYIDSTDKTKLRNILKTRGPTTFTNYDSETFEVVFDKISISKTAVPTKDVVQATDKTESEFYEVSMTCFVGEDL